MIEAHRSPRSPGEVDGKHGVYHDRCQEEKPEVGMEFVEFEVCLVMHEAAREFESRRTAAGKKNQYTQSDIGYAESQDYAQGC
jgi:hypothetical protein